MFEIASSTEWAFQQLSRIFRPNVFVDIEGTLPLKLEGMRLYESEARPFPHPRSTEAITTIAQCYGSLTGCKAAEAFELVRSFDRVCSVIVYSEVCRSNRSSILDMAS